MLSRFFANNIYVQVRKNEFRIRNLETKTERPFPARNPFTTRRLLVGQFSEASKTLRKGIKELAGGVFKPSPVVVVHPLEMAEDGLSEVEERVFRELALGAGARQVIVHVGAVLSDAEVLSKIQTK